LVDGLDKAQATQEFEAIFNKVMAAWDALREESDLYDFKTMITMEQIDS
jgi:hypothetical protein